MFGGLLEKCRDWLGHAWDELDYKGQTGLKKDLVGRDEQHVGPPAGPGRCDTEASPSGPAMDWPCK